jgi:hypothetical protein
LSLHMTVFLFLWVSTFCIWKGNLSLRQGSFGWPKNSLLLAMS